MSENALFSKIPLLSGSRDYVKWALAIRAAAQYATIFRIINGTWALPIAATTPPSAEELAAIEKWEIANEKSTGLISRTCSEDIQILLADQRVDVQTVPVTQRECTAHELWEFLRTQYEKKDGISAIIDWGNLSRLTLSDDGSVSMETQLATLATHRSRVALNGFTYEDWQFAALIVLALPPSFESLRNTFLDGLADPKSLVLHSVIAHVIDKDNRTEASVNAVAGPSRQPKQKGKKKQVASGEKAQKRSKNPPPGACHNCGIEGHWRSECVKPPKKKKPDNQAGSSSSLHVVENDGSSVDANDEPLLCYATSSEDWLMDSGATEHLTPYSTDFVTYTAFSGSDTQQQVTLGDGKTRLRVLGQGAVERWVGTPESSYRLLLLSNVLHVQGIKRRFLSLSTFDDKGFELHMKSKSFTLSKGQLALTGHRVGKLYIAPMWAKRPLHSAVQLSTAVAPLPAKVWHERMGHLNWEALKAAKGSGDLLPLKGIVLTNDLLPHSSTCPGCQAGKSKQETHKSSPTRNQRSTHPCERIHSDLVGPLETASIFGHRYAVSFTCDYTDHVWSIPLKSKDQTFAQFKRIVAVIKTQYGLTVRYFRSDRGGEFMSKEFEAYLGSEGITHETSAPNTPQQNGLAERMQQTIWSGIRAILHHAGLKNGFWSEALAVIIHVLNRAPRKRLDWRTPHEVLTGQVPNVAYFRIFGCRAWVLDKKGKKLDAKSSPMIFVGYEPGSKAYRLWDPRGHKIVISADVNFDESIFPNKPEEKPVTPPTLSDRQGLGPPRTKKSKGSSSKQQLPLLPKDDTSAFVDVSDIYNLEEEENNYRLFQPMAGLLHPQTRALPPPPVQVAQPPIPAQIALPPPPPAQVAPPILAPLLPEYVPNLPIPQDWIPPTVRIQHDAVATPAGSPPVNAGQVPQPASRVVSRSPSPTTDHPHPKWRSPERKFEDTDSEDEVEKDIFVSPDVTMNLSTLAQPSQTPAPEFLAPTPSSVALSLSDHYVSPSPPSPQSSPNPEDAPKNEPRRSRRQKEKQANLAITEEQKLTAFDEAYNESVKLFVTATAHGEPRSYREATNPSNPDAPLWQEAIQAELKSLQDHGTWKIVPRPEGKHIVSCKWVWRIKTKPDGSIERYKARLVARGFTQTRGVDFNETFAPVTRLDTLRLLAATAAQKDWEFRQIDVKTAYLYGDLEEEVYMAVPEGLEGVPEGHVLQLLKALYGLKQAGRQWYKTLKEQLEKFGMKKIESDPHTFIVRRSKMVLIIPIWVDDLFIFGDKRLTDEFEKWIPDVFETTPPCDAHYFLGIRVTRNRITVDPMPYIALDQITFIENVLTVIEQMYNRTITVRKTVLPAAPIVPNEQPKVKADKTKVRVFQSAVGQLMYIMLATRPDLAYPVGMLARHASNPSDDHVNALFHLVGYLKNTIGQVLIYRKPTQNEPNKGVLEAYTDADWAGEAHSGRSTSGMLILKESTPIAWSSKRQGIVSTSTMESEYVAMFHTIQHTLWVLALENQLGINEWKPRVLCDNQAAIASATGGEASFKKSKYIDVKYHWIRDVHERKEVVIDYVRSEDNMADLFTKRLPHNTLSKLRGWFMETYEYRDDPDITFNESSDSQ
jgi:hypothetical protein